MGAVPQEMLEAVAGALQMKKVLVLAYYYPPTGGAGVQRVVKFVKYLPQFGYCPTVVSGTGGQSVCHAAMDEVLGREISEAIHYPLPINGANALPSRAWCELAYAGCCDAIDREKPSCLFVSVSPYYAAGVAARVAKRCGIPWVLDMRDPWALDPFTAYPTRLHHWRDLRAMKAACASATAVIMNTPQSLAALRTAFPGLPRDRLFCITNGWDEDDFRARQGERTVGLPLTITHTGHFQTAYARRTSAHASTFLGGRRKTIKDYLRYFRGSPDLLGRTPYYLLRAVRHGLDRGIIEGNQIRLKFLGQLSDDDKALVSSFGLDELAEYHGYRNHDESVQALVDSDLLFLPLHTGASGGDPLIVPGKTYEYLASERPVLAIVPEGDAREFLRQSGLGYVFDRDDMNGIGDFLGDLVGRKHQGPILSNPDRSCIDRFSRRMLTRQLASIFDRLT